ncbi:MAG: ribosome recycling factor [Rickettsiales bacterium]|jgi:ribosome recycling factor|nr:ribosome recycling factor [Rickettsiales bacterium]
MPFDITAITTEAQTKTAATIEVLKTNFAGLRTGRASVHLLDPIRAEVYGAMMPLDQLATISTPEAQTISISVWDMDAVSKIEKALRESSLGLNPQTNGTLIRLNLPPLTEERRKELVKVAGNYAEETKISLRNIRHDLMAKIKQAGTDKEISEDDQHRFTDDLQKIFDAKTAEVDALTSTKEKDILSI